MDLNAKLAAMSSPDVEQPALSWLWGARIQRIDGPKPGLFALSLFADGDRSVLLIAVSAEARGVGRTLERPKGDAASSFVQRLRRLLENGRLLSATWIGSEAHPERASALRLQVGRGELSTEIIADFDRKTPTLLLLGSDRQLVGASDVKALRPRSLSFGKPFVASPSSQGILIPRDAAALEAAALTLTDQRVESRLDSLKHALHVQLRAALKRAERKATAIEGDLARTAQAPTLRRHASLILCHLSAIARGTASIALIDQSVDPEESVTVTLDPSRDANANAQAMFERARKVERGVGIATQRLEETRREIARLRALENEVTHASEESELEHVSRALGKGALPAQGAPKKRDKVQVRTPFHTFESAGGARILVGKSAADNDTLTLTVARPHDHWLHARGCAGSHVVVPLERGAVLSPEVLIDAAHLAAHFSNVRGEPIAEVAHTERRYVRKPKGAPPGSVNVDREKVLRLRVEPERLQRLLKS